MANMEKLARAFEALKTHQQQTTAAATATSSGEDQSSRWVGHSFNHNHITFNQSGQVMSVSQSADADG